MQQNPEEKQLNTADYYYWIYNNGRLESSNCKIKNYKCSRSYIKSSDLKMQGDLPLFKQEYKKI